jgi:hypothetical protein
MCLTALGGDGRWVSTESVPKISFSIAVIGYQILLLRKLEEFLIIYAYAQNRTLEHARQCVARDCLSAVSACRHRAWRLAVRQ